MDPWVWAVIAVLAAALIGLSVWLAMRNRRAAALRERFGPEYDRVMEETDGRREGERELTARRDARERLDIQPLSPEASSRYADSWRLLQERFVDHPVQAVREADGLVRQVMQDRGYPVSDFEARATIISVDYPGIVENYRSAHAISDRSDAGSASTEDLRQAMVHYRSLFNELLGGDGDVPRAV